MTPPAGRRPMLLLLDGMSLAFRAYFALPPELSRSDGAVTNALHGFTGMLINLVRDHEPSALAVAFDLPGGTFRDDLVTEYKGGRSETPDDLLPQFDMIRELLDVLSVPVVTAEGYEADDVLATLATEARDRDCGALVVTGDRDCFQLVEDPHVRVLYNRRGVSDYSLYDEAGIEERTGVLPPRYPLLAALRGDPSDNLPGVPGVGEKTAARLLTTYGDLEGIYAHLEELTPKLRANLAEHRDQTLLNAQVIPLVRDVPLAVSVEDLELGGWDGEAVQQCFAQYELRTLWRRARPLLDKGALGPPAPGSPPLPEDELGPVLREETADGAEDATADVAAEPPPDKVALDHPADMKATAAGLRAMRDAGGEVAVAARWEGRSGRSTLQGLALVATATSDRGLWVPGAHLANRTVVRALGSLLCAKGATVVGHDVKELFRSLLPLAVDCTNLDLDVAVAAYLIDPSSGDYALPRVLERWCPGGLPAGLAGQVGTTGRAQLALDGPAEDGAVVEAAGLEAAAVAAAAPTVRHALHHEGLSRLYDAVERPLVRVLARMEVAGIRVDSAELRRIADELAAEAASLEREVHRLAGYELNVNSTPQLRTLLYTDLGLTPQRKTKTGYSTDAASLERLRQEHPVVGVLLRYREVEKLRSNFGQSLLAEVAGDGRIHATFRQTVARTGRLSSERPNLHNIPVRTELGRRFRRAFVPTEGWALLVADYDQIELRVLAHLSGDPGLLEAFRTGADVHRRVAAGVYGVPVEEVTATQRERAKMVSYGLAYGMEAYGLAQRLSTGVEEAGEIMSSYFRAFPEVRAYMDGTVEEARARGFTRTPLGRKRPLPELTDRSFRVRQTAERQAMNAGIQGLAADLFKTALVNLDRTLESAKLTSRLVLQVHDEVIVDVAPGEEEQAEAMTRDALTHATDLAVPLEVSMAWGGSWAAAKGG